MTGVVKYLLAPADGGFLTFITHSAGCLTTVPQPLPKPVLHTVWSSASSFNLQQHLISLRSYSSCLRPRPRLSITSLIPSIFPSITCFRRQLLRKMWLIDLAWNFVFGILNNISRHLWLWLKRGHKWRTLYMRTHVRTFMLSRCNQSPQLRQTVLYEVQPKAEEPVEHRTSSMVDFNTLRTGDADLRF